jgi:hypothetical protein
MKSWAWVDEFRYITRVGETLLLHKFLFWRSQLYLNKKKIEFPKEYYIWIWKQQDWEVDQERDSKMKEDGRIGGGEEWQEKVYNREEWKKLLRMERNRHILHVPMEWNELTNMARKMNIFMLRMILILLTFWQDCTLSCQPHNRRRSCTFCTTKRILKLVDCQVWTRVIFKTFFIVHANFLCIVWMFIRLLMWVGIVSVLHSCSDFSHLERCCMLW